MEKTQTTQTIPWMRIAHLVGRRQKWLADELGVSKQAVTNWRTRGSIPLDYATRISALLNLPVEDLLGISDGANSQKRDQNRPLSDAAKRLIFCAAKLDRSGADAHKILEHHAALIEFAAGKIPLEYGAYELNTDEIGRLLQAPEVGATGT